MTTQNVLNQVYAVNLQVSIWSAKTKLKAEDFEHAELPPGDLASLGTKRVCDPNALRIFGTLKSRAVNLLDKVGLRFLGGWAVPQSKAQEVNQQLDEIAQEFHQAKAEFLKKYDHSVQAWIKSNPGWEQIIANSVVSKSYVSSRIGFSWQLFKVTAPADDQDPVAGGLTDALGQLGDTLFEDVARTAAEAWKKSYDGRSEITRKALAPLKHIRKKLTDLSFVEPLAAPAAELVNTALHCIASRGPITDETLNMLKGVLGLLMDKDQLRQFAQGVQDGTVQVDDEIHKRIQSGTRPSRKKKEAVATKPATHKADTQEANAPDEAELVQSAQLASLGLW